MSFLDKAKKTLTKAVDQHGDKIEKGADQLGRTINARTGNKHADKIEKGRAQLRKSMDGRNGRGDDFGKR
jgi:hypothetical protein